MPLSQEWIDPRVGEGVTDILTLAEFDGAPKDFWPLYLRAVQKLGAADSVTLFLRSQNAESDDAHWKRISQVRRENTPVAQALVKQLEPAVATIAAYAEEHDGCVLAPQELITPADLPKGSKDHAVLAFAPRLHNQSESCVAVLIAPGLSEADATEALLRLKLAAPLPEIFEKGLGSKRASQDVKKIATALDLSVLANREEKYLACALAFCNGLAAQLGCDRVSLGWMEKGLIRLRAMSRTEKFDHKMEASQQLEAAMDEAFDQDDEITWPAPDGTPAIARDHQRFCEGQHAGHLASIPLRVEDRAVGVITCERKSHAFDDVELRQLRLACDLVGRRLEDLKVRDRWVGARMATSTRNACASLLGPSHTWLKVGCLLAAVTLAVLIFVKVPYRVEANFVLRSDEVSFVTAPLDSYIAAVNVRAGDQIKKGTPLLTLDMTSLNLEKASAEADFARYQREMEKARAEGKLAEMRISQSLADQAKVRLDLAEHRILQSSIVAPFDAYVVEGDQRDRIGAPVKRGDTLFRLARIDSLYVESQVPERDVHEVLGKDSGEIAFVSRPADKHAVTIENVVPAAIAEEAGNTFMVRCRFVDPPDEWARPGMSGVCKLSVGERSLGWILTHRTTDFLRMYFWW